MISLFVLIGSIVIIGGSLIAAFWEDIRKWLIRAAEEVKRIIQKGVEIIKIFFKKIRNGVQKISKHFYRVFGGWYKIEVSTPIPIEDVPEEYLKELTTEGVEKDFTNVLKLQLSN